MSQEEIDTFINYLDSLGPADMRDGTYDVRLTHAELEYIIDAVELSSKGPLYQ